MQGQHDAGESEKRKNEAGKMRVTNYIANIRNKLNQIEISRSWGRMSKCSNFTGLTGHHRISTLERFTFITFYREYIVVKNI